MALRQRCLVWFRLRVRIWICLRLRLSIRFLHPRVVHHAFHLLSCIHRLHLCIHSPRAPRSEALASSWLSWHGSSLSKRFFFLLDETFATRSKYFLHLCRVAQRKLHSKEHLILEDPSCRRRIGSGVYTFSPVTPR